MTPILIEDESSLAPWAGCAFVPTMGALHEGHASLIRAAARSGRPAVVSIFVNPTQFGPNEDFSRYPRSLEADLVTCAAAGAAAVFVPSVDAMYPRGIAVAREEAERLALPAVATQPRLEDACRPGHFAGVVQVVTRLFELVRPSVAHFGEKDWQQLRVITEMVAMHPTQFDGLRIVPEPTVRLDNGLAMSSRNRYLAPDQIEAARGLSRALQVACAAQHPGTAEALMHGTLEEHGLEVQYAVVRSAHALLPVQGFEAPTRGLIAAKLGTIRLIDTMALPIWR
ncbi:MAG: pantoate--beta-alanine ligase [Phycisphaerae bacterium]|nr:pantoate--beta-alanine ligase [Phycisphaerae bacterium]